MRVQSFAALSTFCLVFPTCQAVCTSAQRIAGAQLIPYSYNLVDPGASATSFATVPFAPNCTCCIWPNGGPGIETAIDDTTTVDFAIATRQIFTKVTGEYTDFPNGTTIIHTDVTLGALHAISLPITFTANVYLTYDLETCEIYAVQAYATIPSVVAGVSIQPPILSQILAVAPVQAPCPIV